MKLRLKTFPAPRRRWGTLLRSILYSASLVALLTYVSYHYIFAHPSLVRSRVESWTSGLVRGSVEVGKSRHGRGDSLQIERIALYEGPPSARSLGVELLGVQVIPPGGQGASYRVRPGRRLRQIFRSVGEERPPAARVSTREGNLHLRYRQSAGESWWKRWNLGRFLEREPVERSLSEESLEFTMEKARVQLDWPGRFELPEPWKVVDLRLASHRTGFALDGQLLSGPIWDHGYFEAFVDWTKILRAHFRMENCRDLQGWMPFLPDSLRSLWEESRLQGVISLEGSIEHSVLESKTAWKVEMESFDTSLRLPPSGLEVESLRGRMRLDEGGLSWGEPATVPHALCTIWGVRIGLSGVLGPVKSELSLQVPVTPLETIRPSRSPPYLGSLLRRLRPTGEMEGTVTLVASPDQKSWKGNFVLREASPVHLPGIQLVEGTLATERSGTGGKGTLAIRELSLGKMLGSLRGTVAVTWGPDRWTLEAKDLEVSPAREPPAGESSPPRMSGTFVEDRKLDTCSARLRWENLPVVCGLLDIQSATGELRTPEDVVLRSSTELAWGSSKLKKIHFPRGAVGPEPLDFESGRCSWKVRDWGIEIIPLHMASTSSNRVLRAYGRLGFTGEIDLFCLLVRGSAAKVVDLLDLGKPVSEWVPEDDRDDEVYEYYRIRGTLEKPSPTRISGRDFVLLSPFAEKG